MTRLEDRGRHFSAEPPAGAAACGPPDIDAPPGTWRVDAYAEHVANVTKLADHTLQDLHEVDGARRALRIIAQDARDAYADYLASPETQVARRLDRQKLRSDVADAEEALRRVLEHVPASLPGPINQPREDWWGLEQISGDDAWGILERAELMLMELSRRLDAHRTRGETDPGRRLAAQTMNGPLLLIVNAVGMEALPRWAIMEACWRDAGLGDLATNSNDFRKVLKRLVR